MPEGSAAKAPLIARVNDLLKYARDRERGIRIVSSIRLPFETLWEGGEWSEGKVYLSENFEVGFFLPHHAQDFHAHTHSYEIYVMFGKGEIRYVDNERKCIEVSKVYAGDVVIFPPNIYHIVSLSTGHGLVVIVRDRGYAEEHDKIILKDELPECRKESITQALSSPSGVRG